MRIGIVSLSIAMLILLFMRPAWVVQAATSEVSAKSVGNWDEDFRRCLIRKRFDRGSVTISIGDGSLEIYVLWDDGKGLDELKETKILAGIDQDQFQLRGQVSAAGTPASTYELGPFAKIAPLLGKGRWLTLAFAEHPKRDLRLPIGNGKKAIDFLKTCKSYWEKWRQRHP